MFTFSYPKEKYFEPAGFGVRLAAYIIDLVAMIIILKIFSWITSLVGFRLSDTTELLIFTIYMVLFTWKYGRTFGKYHTTLKVETIDGKPISFVQSVLRSIFYWALVIVPYVFGALGLSNLEYDASTGSVNASNANLFLTLLTTLGSYALICILIIVDGLFIAFRKDKRALHYLISGTRCMKK